MGSLGIPELVVIVTILVLIFGANRLPEIGRGMGKRHPELQGRRRARA